MALERLGFPVRTSLPDPDTAGPIGRGQEDAIGTELNGGWNEFIAALIFMNKETEFTVPIMLVGVRQGHFGAVDWGALQAGVVISIVPRFLIYLLLQKYYVSGLLSGAIK